MTLAHRVKMNAASFDKSAHSFALQLFAMHNIITELIKTKKISRIKRGVEGQIAKEL